MGCRPSSLHRDVWLRLSVIVGLVTRTASFSVTNRLPRRKGRTVHRSPRLVRTRGGESPSQNLVGPRLPPLPPRALASAGVGVASAVESCDEADEWVPPCRPPESVRLRLRP